MQNADICVTFDHETSAMKYKYQIYLSWVVFFNQFFVAVLVLDLGLLWTFNSNDFI